MNHIWLSGKNATDHNLVPEIRASRARSRLRRAFAKIRLARRIQKLREQEEDPIDSDLSDLFREVALAKIMDDKEEKEVQQLTEKVEKETKTGSFKA